MSAETPSMAAGKPKFSMSMATLKLSMLRSCDAYITCADTQTMTKLPPYTPLMTDIQKFIFVCP